MRTNFSVSLERIISEFSLEILTLSSSAEDIKIRLSLILEKAFSFCSAKADAFAQYRVPRGLSPWWGCWG